MSEETAKRITEAKAEEAEQQELVDDVQDFLGVLLGTGRNARCHRI